MPRPTLHSERSFLAESARAVDFMLQPMVPQSDPLRDPHYSFAPPGMTELEAAVAPGAYAAMSARAAAFMSEPMTQCVGCQSTPLWLGAGDPADPQDDPNASTGHVGVGLDAFTTFTNVALDDPEGVPPAAPAQPASPGYTQSGPANPGSGAFTPPADLQAAVLFDGHSQSDVAFFEGLVAQEAPDAELLVHTLDPRTPTRAILLFGDMRFPAGISGGVGTVEIVVIEEVNTSFLGFCVPGSPNAPRCFAGYRVLGSASGVRVMFMDLREDDHPPLEEADVLQGLEDADVSAIEESAEGDVPSITDAEFLYVAIVWELTLVVESDAFFSQAMLLQPPAPTATLSVLMDKWFHLADVSFASLCAQGDLGGAGPSDWQVTLEIPPHPPTAIPEPDTISFVTGLCAAVEQAALVMWDAVWNGANEAADAVPQPIATPAMELQELLASIYIVARFYDGETARERCPC